MNLKKQFSKPLFKKILRIFAKTVLVFFIIFIVLILFIRSPWGQDLIVGRVTNYVSEKIDTKFEIDKLYLTFSGNLTLEKLLLEDEAKDTLLYTRYLEADLPLMPLLFGDDINVDLVDWKGVKANVKRKDSIQGYNYQFIIDAFASEEIEKQETENEESPNISIGSLAFSDFDLSYQDQISGIDTRLKLGKFNLESEEIDLKAMKFHFSEIHLEQTSLNYRQSNSFQSEDNAEASTLPQIIIDQFSIKETKLNYTSIPDEINSEIKLEKFNFQELNADLNNQVISLENIALRDSQFDLKMDTNAKKETSENKTQDEDQSFSWPEWEVEIAEIEFENNIIDISQNEQQPTKGQFSAEAIALRSFDFDAENLELSKNEQLGFKLNKLQFKDKSGLELKQFSLNTQLDENSIALKDIRLEVNNSSLFADLQLDYNTIQSFINSPDKAYFDFSIQKFQIDGADAYLFSPELKQNPNFKNLTKHKFTGDLRLTGNLDQLQIPKFDLNWGKDTSLNLVGNLSQVTYVDDLGVNLKNYAFTTSKIDIGGFIQEDSLGISIPKSLVLKGKLEKNADTFSTQSQLQTPKGIIDVKGNFSNKNTIEYALNLDVNSLKLGNIFQNPKIGELNISVFSKGKGNSIYDLTAEFSSKIDSIRIADYNYSKMELNAQLKKGKGNVNFDYEDDDNLKFNLISNIDLDSLSSQIDTEIDLQGMKSKKLGLTDKDIRAKVLANIKFKGNLDDFSLDANLNDGLVIYEEESYNLGNINFTTTLDATQTKAAFSSPFLNLNLNANANIENIAKALTTHFERQLNSDFSKPRTTADSLVKLDADLSFTEIPILSEVFMEGIQEMDTLKSNLHFDEGKQTLTASTSLPYLKFNENEINDLKFNLESDKNAFTFDFGFDNIKATPLNVAQTDITGSFKNNSLDVNLKALKDDETFFNSSIATAFESDELYRIKLSPENLILNGKPWSIHENNEIVYQNNAIQVSDFVLNRNDQEIKLTDDLQVKKTHLGIDFKNFKLSSIVNYFNPDEALANGDLEGDLVVIEPFSSKGLISNLQIDNLKITQVLLGNLKLKAEAKSDENYNLDLSLKDAGIDFNLNGNYHTNANEADVDFDLNLNKLNVKKIEDFAGDYIKDSNGNLYGNLKVKGNLSDLSYDGFLGFDKAKFNVKTLNTVFKFKNEKIDLTNNKMILKEFAIEDENGNMITANGNATFEELTNPAFNLNFEAQNFQLLNSTAEDNDLYYGKLTFNASAELTGNLNLPKLNLDLTIKDESDLTYIVPTSQASIEERDGVVVFVNKENPDNIMTQQADDALDAKISGIELKSNIKIEKQSKVKVVIDKRTNDHISIQGGGDFKFDMDKSGKMDLVGKYEIITGSVELNLYNLVKRKFEISPKSSVSWSGNPYNADIDLRAIYKIETSASALMASQTAGENLSFQNKYRQELPFLIYMDIKGELTSPKLSFELDMPEDKQGAIDGSVYGRIKQVNQEEDQLNKHVFSLLVLSKFYPDAVSDGSQGGGASIVSKKLNQALSDQLNTFSEKLIGDTGISLNFDVNSYTDYRGNTMEDRTDVDITAQKKLLDDRLVIEAGSSVNVQGSQRSNSSQTGLNNVSVEYLLTEDGRWKLKGFRKSEYENVIDGQVFISGVGLIFTREFNKFKELWNEAYRKSLKEEEAETEDKKKDSNQKKQ